MAGRLTKCEPRHQQQECHHSNLCIGPYLGVVSKFWAVEDVITRSRTASGHVDGAVLAYTIMFIRLLMTILRTSTTLADFSRARDSQITFSVTHGWSAFWRGRPWLAG